MVSTHSVASASAEGHRGKKYHVVRKLLTSWTIHLRALPFRFTQLQRPCASVLVCEEDGAPLSRVCFAVTVFIRPDRWRRDNKSENVRDALLYIALKICLVALSDSFSQPHIYIRPTKSRNEDAHFKSLGLYSWYDNMYNKQTFIPPLSLQSTSKEGFQHFGSLLFYRRNTDEPDPSLQDLSGKRDERRGELVRRSSVLFTYLLVR